MDFYFTTSCRLLVLGTLGRWNCGSWFLMMMGWDDSKISKLSICESNCHKIDSRVGLTSIDTRFPSSFQQAIYLWSLDSKHHYFSCMPIDFFPAISACDQRVIPKVMWWFVNKISLIFNWKKVENIRSVSARWINRTWGKSAWKCKQSSI